MARGHDDDETTTTGPIFEAMDPATRRTLGGEAIVVVLYPPDANPGRRFALSRTDHQVGRRPDLDVPIELDSVSRRHARFVKDGESWVIEDLGSTNGTYVNDERVEKRQLRDGDIVRFGEGVVKFLAGSNIERAYHEEIYRLSILDGLTGIHNKRFFNEFLDKEVARAYRHGGTVSLVLFDIDHFKRVNDTFGHLAGDAVLQALARRLRQRIRKEDLIARVGGEEFACILPDTKLPGALMFAEQLRSITEKEAFTVEGGDLQVTISLGVAELNPTEAKIEAQELVKRADEKLYAAKRSGRNKVES
jgi:two-component system, cell cycle response regulator